jgi:hypothetical protein
MILIQIIFSLVMRIANQIGQIKHMHNSLHKLRIVHWYLKKKPHNIELKLKSKNENLTREIIRSFFKLIQKKAYSIILIKEHDITTT